MRFGGIGFLLVINIEEFMYRSLGDCDIYFINEKIKVRGKVINLCKVI